MDINELLLKICNGVHGGFGDLNCFDFKGVYILCDNNKIVYVGSSYARTIKQRLKQYTSKKDTGNTLAKRVAKELSYSKKINGKSKENILEAIEKIKKFSIYAIKYQDLEYQLIDLAKPIYNIHGKKDN